MPASMGTLGTVMSSYLPTQGRTKYYERGVSKRESEIVLINIHNIHTRMLRFVSQSCGLLISPGIGPESPMLRPKV